ncbi:hypothetical protein J6590_047979 [Homalodisca vitripennis]|nr:hypothetical protein J6590_047979 [Homalodisca vitripennis]
MSNALTEAMPIGVSWLSPYPDFLSCGFILVLALLLAWGVKESSFLNNVFTAVNLCTVALVVIVGAFYINVQNWALDPDAAPDKDGSGKVVKAGMGGFMPFGVSGIMAGAAKCFYGFVGFDCVATTGEEAKNPKRDIPLSIIISLLIIFLAYFSIASVMTLMWPYYLQDEAAPIPYVFGEIGQPVVKLIVSVGAIFALCTRRKLPKAPCLIPQKCGAHKSGKDKFWFMRFKEGGFGTEDKEHQGRPETFKHEEHIGRRFLPKTRRTCGNIGSNSGIGQINSIRVKAMDMIQKR